MITKQAVTEALPKIIVPLFVFLHDLPWRKGPVAVRSAIFEVICERMSRLSPRWEWQWSIFVGREATSVALELGQTGVSLIRQHIEYNSSGQHIEYNSAGLVLMSRPRITDDHQARMNEFTLDKQDAHTIQLAHDIMVMVAEAVGQVWDEMKLSRRCPRCQRVLLSDVVPDADTMDRLWITLRCPACDHSLKVWDKIDLYSASWNYNRERIMANIWYKAFVDSISGRAAGT